MNRINTITAYAINSKLAIFGHETEAENTTPYFIGWLADYVGPRNPRYKAEGAHYDGKILTEVSATVADCLKDLLSTEDLADLLNRYTPADMIAAAGLIGACNAMAHPGDEF